MSVTGSLRGADAFFGAETTLLSSVQDIVARNKILQGRVLNIPLKDSHYDQAESSIHPQTLFL